LAGSDDSVLKNKVALEQALVDLAKEKLSLAKETAKYQKLVAEEKDGDHAQKVLESESERLEKVTQ